MARNNHYALVMKRAGFTQGTLDLLCEDGSTPIEKRAERIFYSMGYRTHLREFTTGYKEGRAAFDKADSALIANPYDYAEFQA